MSFICKKYTKMKKTFLLVCAIAVFASCKKNDLAKEYQKLQKTQLPECNKKIK